MSFNSLLFFVFLAVVLAVHFRLPDRFRWMLLLTASYVFYMSWRVEHGLLLLTATAINYGAGLALPRLRSVVARRLVLSLAVAASMGMLFMFKYAEFVLGQTRGLCSLFGWDTAIPTLKFVLPIGISFFTFQTVSYTVDVYRGGVLPERHFGRFALYVSFFPHLVAGPIMRTSALLPQLSTFKEFDWLRFRTGCELIIWGLFKKMVVADRLARFVDVVYGDVTAYTGMPLVVAAVFFAFQVYADFSGYTDIAIGCAHIMGVELTENFRRPYYSKNPAEFWRRWHISLSTWFRDYVFTPLYLRLGALRALAGLSYRGRHTVAFVLSSLVGLFLLGLWHGANWTFGLFGLYQAGLVLSYHFTGRWWDRAPKVAQIGTTFALIVLGDVLFRAPSVKHAAYIVCHLFRFDTLWLNAESFHLERFYFLTSFFFIGLMEMFHLMQRRTGARDMLTRRPDWQRYACYAILAVSVWLFGQYETKAFVYFRF